MCALLRTFLQQWKAFTHHMCFFVQIIFFTLIIGITGQKYFHPECKYHAAKKKIKALIFLHFSLFFTYVSHNHKTNNNVRHAFYLCISATSIVRDANNKGHNLKDSRQLLSPLRWGVSVCKSAANCPHNILKHFPSVSTPKPSDWPLLKNLFFSDSVANLRCGRCEEFEHFSWGLCLKLEIAFLQSKGNDWMIKALTKLLDLIS